MRKQCAPGSFFSAHALEPGNKATLIHATVLSATGVTTLTLQCGNDNRLQCPVQNLVISSVLYELSDACTCTTYWHQKSNLLTSKSKFLLGKLFALISTAIMLHI